MDRFGCLRILMFGDTADLSNLETLKEEVQSILKYVGKLEDGEFSPIWTNLARKKISRLLEIYKTIYKGVVEEIENTKLD